MHKRRHVPAVTVTVTFMMALLYGATVYNGEFFNALILDRSGIVNGEYWRLASAHLLNVDLAHVTINILACLVIGGYLETTHGSRFTVLVVLASSLLISLSILVATDVQRYCGFSGVANALFILVVTGMWRKGGGVLPVALLLLYLLKLLMDFSARRDSLLNYAWPVLPEAHLAGLIAGLFIMGVEELITSWLKKQRSLIRICTDMAD